MTHGKRKQLLEPHDSSSIAGARRRAVIYLTQVLIEDRNEAVTQALLGKGAH